MAVPKKKISKSKRNQRRAHDYIEPVSIAYDSVTGEPKLPHHMSLKDGYYNGRVVFSKKKKLEGKDSEQKDKEDIKTNE